MNLTANSNSDGFKIVNIDTLPKGVLFNIVLIGAFCMPHPLLTAFGIGGIITNLREIGLIALPLIYLAVPGKGIQLVSWKIRRMSVVLLCTFLFSELMKALLYGNSAIDSIKELRLILPLISGIFLLLQGVKIRPKPIINSLFIAFSVSFIVTIVFMLLNKSMTSVALGDNAEIDSAENGRFYNQNASFGIIGIVLFIRISQYNFKSRTIANIGLVTCLLSALLTFNRTLAFAMAITALMSVIGKISIGSFLKTAAIFTVAFFAIVYVYNSNDSVKRQIDKRVLSLIQSENKISAFKENVYDSNRKPIYESYRAVFAKYYLFGTPYQTPLYSKGDRNWTTTDISVLTIALRFGIISAFVYIMFILGILFFLFRYKSRFLHFKVLLPIFSLAILVSFNIDILSRQNFIFHMLLLLMFGTLLHKSVSVKQLEP